MSSIFDNPKQTRNKKGQFNKKTSPPKPSTRIKRAKIGKVARAALTIPRGFMGESKYLKRPTRPMGLKEKKAWWAEQQEKSEARTKVRAKLAKKRSKNTRKVLRKAWKTIW
jgi:hypothetical protein